MPKLIEEIDEPQFAEWLAAIEKNKVVKKTLGNGLYFHQTKHNKWYFTYRDQFKGVDETYTRIGDYPETSFNEARQEARKLRKDLQQETTNIRKKNLLDSRTNQHKKKQKPKQKYDYLETLEQYRNLADALLAQKHYLIKSEIPLSNVRNFVTDSNRLSGYIENQIVDYLLILLLNPTIAIDPYNAFKAPNDSWTPFLQRWPIYVPNAVKPTNLRHPSNFDNFIPLNYFNNYRFELWTVSIYLDAPNSPTQSYKEYYFNHLANLSQEDLQSEIEGVMSKLKIRNVFSRKNNKQFFKEVLANYLHLPKEQINRVMRIPIHKATGYHYFEIAGILEWWAFEILKGINGFDRADISSSPMRTVNNSSKFIRF